MAVLANDIGKEFIEMLGLPKETKWFEIRFHVDEAVTIKCEHYANEASLNLIKTILREYTLIEKNDTQKGA